MTTTYTIVFTRTRSGYTGQIVEWPEVISEGDTLEECRSSVEDALKEMIQAFRQLGRRIPRGRSPDSP